MKANEIIESIHANYLTRFVVYDKNARDLAFPVYYATVEEHFVDGVSQGPALILKSHFENIQAQRINNTAYFLEHTESPKDVTTTSVPDHLDHLTGEMESPHDAPVLVDCGDMGYVEIQAESVLGRDVDLAIELPEQYETEVDGLNNLRLAGGGPILWIKRVFMQTRPNMTEAADKDGLIRGFAYVREGDDPQPRLDDNYHILLRPDGFFSLTLCNNEYEAETLSELEGRFIADFLRDEFRDEFGLPNIEIV